MSEQLDIFMAADQVIETLQGHAHTAYRVGGCVRDQLLQRPISDIDIATSATPDEVIAIFERTVPTGIQHGTVLVFQGAFAFEVTTFRTESAYQDFRRPSEVQFVTRIEDDLARRDFTINAMAQLPDGTIIDPFLGQTDLSKRMVRCVGNAGVRFEEDALRLLRAVRFAAQLNFTIEVETMAAIVAQRKLLGHIAMERVGQEFVKIMDCDHVLYGLQLLSDSELLQHTKHQLHIDALYFSRQIKTFGHLESIPAGPVRWAAFFIGLNYAVRDATRLLTALKLPNALQQAVADLLTIHIYLRQTGNRKHIWVHAVLNTSRKSAVEYLMLADENQRVDYSNWLENMEATSVSELPISGNDLIELGIRRGPKMGNILKTLLERVALGEVKNEREELLRMAKQLGEQTR
jgi:tRNA nucleotidyltransferase (CCA-adding enzyme)